MGNSTITVQDTVDVIESMGDVAPSAKPGSYATKTTLAIATDTMNDLIARRFNWKWNSALAPTFLTNAWQQDYPIVGLSNIGWLTEAWWLDINSLSRPIDPQDMTCVREIAQGSGSASGPPELLCWDYADQLQLGTWPGAGQLFAPLKGGARPQANPTMNMVDANGNLLVLTSFGTTGATAPLLPANSAEGQTVTDGTCTWTCCSLKSQSFRIGPRPAVSGVVYEVHCRYQKSAVKFTDIMQTIDPIPDDYGHHFRRGFMAYCYKYSPDASARQQFPGMQQGWLQSMAEAEAQSERESDNFMLRPATQIIQQQYRRNPRSAARPY